MKKVLFAGLLAIAGVSVSAQNLIKNEKFATEVKTKVTNANKATAGEWFIMNNEADGATTIAWEQTGDAKYPNAMKIDNSGAEKNISWYKAFLGQRVTDGLEKGIYVLTFYAKAKEAGTPVSVYIKQTNEEKNDNGKYNTTFFMRRDYDADAQPNASGAQYNFKIKDADKWTKVKDCPGFETFGADVKEARKAKNLARKDLAEKVNIDTRYLANIENEGTIPSLPVIIQLVKICGLPMERYFNPEVMREESELRQRVGQKLKLCPEQYLPIVEGAIDGALKIEKPNEETEGV